MKTHKTCKECGVTYEVAMFSKKGKYKYKSKCKLCFNPTGRAFSPYYYSTAEMQQIAVSNSDRMYKQLYYGIPKCTKCDIVVDRRKKLCSSCKKQSVAIRHRRNSSKRERTKRDKLTGSYVRKSLLSKTSRYLFGLRSGDIPDDLVDLKRKQLLLKRQLK